MSRFSLAGPDWSGISGVATVDTLQQRLHPTAQDFCVLLVHVGGYMISFDSLVCLEEQSLV